MTPIQSIRNYLSPVGLMRATPVYNEEGFRELTRRLRPGEQALLQEELARVKHGQVASLVRAVREGNWRAAVFKERNYPHIALKAYQMNSITVEQFATIMFYWVNFTKVEKEPKIVPLFLEGGVVNPEARRLVRQTLILRRITDSDMSRVYAQSPETPVLTEEQIDALFKKIGEEHPPSAHYLFLKEREETPDLIARIQQLGFNILYETGDGAIIPPLELVNTYLQIKYGPNALRAKPVLGLSTPKDIEESLAEGLRDLGLHFPGTSLPPLVDGYGAPDYAFTWHDIYHLLLISALLKKYQELFLKIGRFAKEYFEKTNLSFANKFYEYIIDMEFPVAQDDLFNRLFENIPPDQKMNHIFWEAIRTSFLRAHASLLNPLVAALIPYSMVLVGPEEKLFIEAVLNFIPMDDDYRLGRKKRDGGSRSGS